jgi:hypothetical protein
VNTIRTIVISAATTIAVFWAIGAYSRRTGWTLVPPTGNPSDEST